MQQPSRTEQIIKHKNFLKKKIHIAEKYLLNIKDLNPSKIDLELHEVSKGSVDEALFRWWNFIWWSVPYQQAYGRQMKFLIWDKGHNAPFGLIGLQSPVLKLSVRDSYLKIPKEELDLWVNKSMQAQRLGALPPYNSLIGGKMAALAMTSNEVRKYYHDKYHDKKTLMKNRVIDANLLFITTSSAFGRSSIYNRLKYKDNKVAISLGYTKGFGSFHIPEDLYKEIQIFLKSNKVDISTTFSNGPSRKIKLLGTAFKLLKVPNYSYHNLKREFFLFPLASNLDKVIHKGNRPQYYRRSLKNLTSFWKERWCLPRAKRYKQWQSFNSKKFITNVKKELNGGL